MTQEAINRFEEKYIPVTESGCWLWIAGTNTDGYGSFWHEKEQVRAHRFSYEFHIEDIPENMVVCHKCDVPSCVNPDHLFIGTPADNMRDRDEKGRHWACKGEDSGTSKLTDKDILSIREDARTQRAIAKHYKIDQSAVSLIKSRKRWRHL